MRPPPVAEEAAPKHRPIRSFVLRQGRLTPAQQRAFDAHWTRYGRDLSGQPVDWNDVFGRAAERVLEIGFGNGEALAHAVTAEPHRDFIGIEVHRPGVGRLLNAAATAEIENLRVYCHDAVEVLREDFATDSLDEVRIWFPDPWHKKRHNKRRLIQTSFLDLISSRLRPGGLLHLATDWAAYAEHMKEVAEPHPEFRNELGPGQDSERPPWRIPTHFEQRGQRLGHGVWDFLYRRR